MKLKYTALTIAALMCVTSVAGVVAHPSAKAIRSASMSLDAVVPKNFGEWTELPTQVQVVNPQTKQLLDSLYSQTVTRTYADRQGYRVMLSLAYGDDQREGGLAAHRPEVCYPAQGFKLSKVEDGTLATPFGNVEVRRLGTSLGTRNEPVTYWLTVGDEVIRSRAQKRFVELRLALTGQIPDGLLFRVSSIDADESRGYAMQQKFTADLLAAVPAKARQQLSGLTNPAAAVQPAL